jgi:tRNA threonylcarbamoyl adenosine modification protein YeaZ
MRALALDTAHRRRLSVALVKEGVVVDEFASNEDCSQARDTTAAVEFLLVRSGWRYEDLSHVFVNEGPGSFTGIRVGLSAAIALECALGPRVKLVGVSSVAAYERALLEAGVSGTDYLVAVALSRASFAVKRGGRDEIKVMTLGELQSLRAGHALGDCRETLQPCGTLLDLRRSVAAFCGLVGCELVSRGVGTYPVGAYPS